MSAGNWYGDVSTFLCSWRYDTDLISHWSAFNPTHGPTKIFLVNPSTDSDDCPALCCLRHRPGRKMFLDLCRFSWFSNDFMFIFQHATKVFQHVSKFNFVHRCVVCPTGRVDKWFWTLDGGTPQAPPLSTSFTDSWVWMNCIRTIPPHSKRRRQYGKILGPRAVFSRTVPSSWIGGVWYGH